jgi:hypothetical protein
MQLLLILENSKIYIKTYIKIAPTCFGLRPSSGTLLLSRSNKPLHLQWVSKRGHNENERNIRELLVKKRTGMDSERDGRGVIQVISR